jgi:hypothetical protein
VFLAPEFAPEAGGDGRPLVLLWNDALDLISVVVVLGPEDLRNGLVFDSRREGGDSTAFADVPDKPSSCDGSGAFRGSSRYLDACRHTRSVFRSGIEHAIRGLRHVPILYPRLVPF